MRHARGHRLQRYRPEWKAVHFYSVTYKKSLYSRGLNIFVFINKDLKHSKCERSTLALTSKGSVFWVCFLFIHLVYATKKTSYFCERVLHSPHTAQTVIYVATIILVCHRCPAKSVRTNVLRVENSKPALSLKWIILIRSIHLDGKFAPN